MSVDSLLYRLVLLAHLLTVVVGFGSAFAWSLVGARARATGAAAGAGLARLGREGTGALTAPSIWLAGLSGFLLILFHQIDDFGPYSFADPWISIGFLLFFVAAGVTQFLWLPAQRKVGDLLGELENLPEGAVRPEETLARLEEQGRRVAMWTGVVHLAFILLMIDMIWKPGA